MKHGSLFSGIGGFDLAAHWAGIDTVFACEIDEWSRKVLAKRFPNTTIYSDIKEANFEQYCGTVDVISGGFPCQPFSLAGKRRGTTDDRYLWGEMLRVVREVEPTWVIAENVRGLTTISGGDTFETVCDDLEVSGYEVQPFIIPALSVGACHQRERLWIVAYRNRLRRNKGEHECGNFSEQIPRTPSGQLGRADISVGGMVIEPIQRAFKGDIVGAVMLSDRNLAYTDCNGYSKERAEQQAEGSCDCCCGVADATNSHHDKPEQSQCHHETGGCSSEPRLGDGVGTSFRSEFRDIAERIGNMGGSSEGIYESDTPNGKIRGLEGSRVPQLQRPRITEHYRRQEWSENWPEALARIYGMDDGLPGGVDRLNERYKDRSRKNRIKAMGNAIVPQVAYQIFQTIREVECL